MPDVNILVKAKDQASKVLGTVGKGVKSLGGALSSVGIGAPVALGAVAVGVVKLAYDAAMLEPTQITFENLSESIDATGDSLLEKLRPATMGMVSDAGLMAAANKMIAMGLADTEDAAADMAEMAVTLGMAMGNNATKSMEDFALMMANQSILRLDTFGISSSVVKVRIVELMDATEGMTREMAFNQAVMEQGAVAMEKVGDISGTTAVKMAKVRVAIKEAKQAIGEALVPVLDTAATAFLNLLEDSRKSREELKKWKRETYEATRTEKEFVAAMRAARPEWRQFLIDVYELGTGYKDTADKEDYLNEQMEASRRMATELMEDFTYLDHGVRDTAEGVAILGDELEDTAEKAAEAAMKMHIAYAGQVLGLREAGEAYDELRNKVISYYADTTRMTEDYQTGVTRAEEDALIQREDLLEKQVEKRAWLESGDHARSKKENEEAWAYWEAIWAEELGEFDEGITLKATRREEDYQHSIEVAQRGAAERGAIAEAERQAELARMRTAQEERLLLFAFEMLEHKGLLKFSGEGYEDLEISAQDYFDLVQAGIIPLSASLVTNLGGTLDELGGGWDDLEGDAATSVEGMHKMVSTKFPDIFNISRKAIEGVGTEAGALEGKMADMGLATQLMAGGIKTGMDEDVIPALQAAQEDAETTETYFEELGIVGVEAFDNIEVEILEVITLTGDLGTKVLAIMPGIGESIRRGMEDPTEDVIDDLKDVQKELNDLDGTRVDIHYHYWHHHHGSPP